MVAPLSSFVQTYEGGLGGEPGNEAHGGYTFCGVAALVLVDQAHQLDLPRLIHWAVHMQVCDLSPPYPALPCPPLPSLSVSQASLRPLAKLACDTQASVEPPLAAQSSLSSAYQDGRQPKPFQHVAGSCVQQTRESCSGFRIYP